VELLTKTTSIEFGEKAIKEQVRVIWRYSLLGAGSGYLAIQSLRSRLGFFGDTVFKEQAWVIWRYSL
jgi:hypothetical protein